MSREPSIPAPVGARQAATIAPQPEPPAPQAEDVRIEAKRSLTLGCGKSSITLHSNGKIELRGLYIISDADGVQRIAGGQIELN